MKFKRNIIIAVVLTALICSTVTYQVTMSLAPKPGGFQLVKVGNHPTLDLEYMSVEVGWSFAKSDYNMVVDTPIFSGPDIATAALLKGEVDIIPLALPDAIKAKRGGADITIFMLRHKELDQWLVTKPGITSVEDLVGKTVAVGSIGGGFSWCSTQFLISANPQLKDKMNIMLIKGSENRAAALIRGDIDATWCESGDLQKLAESGITPLISLHDICPGLIGMVWVATTDYIAKNPETIQELTESLIKGYRDCYQTDTLVNITMQKIPFAITEADALSGLASWRKMQIWDANGGPTQAQWDNALEFYMRSGDITQEDLQKISYSTFVDTQFTNNAIEKLGTFTYP